MVSLGRTATSASGSLRTVPPRCAPAPQTEHIRKLRDEDIAYQAMRASGPGGQHVNKTDSAVRPTHLPTGLTAFSQEQRSQFANRKIARLKLAMLFEEQRERGAHISGRPSA